MFSLEKVINTDSWIHWCCRWGALASPGTPWASETQTGNHETHVCIFPSRR